MNTSSRGEIVPAFYQLYMNYLGIDRFDDIWSGIIIKKIADHLGDNLSLGAPLVFHSKRPRDTNRDIQKEREGLAMNQTFWKLVDEMMFEADNYQTCYLEVVEGIQRRLERFSVKLHRDFVKMQARMMSRWISAVEALE